MERNAFGAIVWLVLLIVVAAVFARLRRRRNAIAASVRDRNRSEPHVPEHEVSKGR